MEIPRTTAAGAHRELTGRLRLRPGCKGGHFLMSHVHPLNLALTPNRICQAIQAVTHDSVDALHTCGSKCRGKLLGNGFHLLLRRTDSRKPYPTTSRTTRRRF